MKKGVLTIALGEAYVGLASNLAYSFLCFNSTDEIGFSIVSNKPIEIDKKLIKYGVSVVVASDLTYEQESVLLNKLLVPNFSPFEQTLMLDADCLIAGSLLPLFSMLEGNDFAVIGETISNGFWHVHVNQILQNFSIPNLYKFVGSLYYFSQNKKVENLYKKALEISKSCDDIGIRRIHHGFINEEVPLSIALAIFKEELVFKMLPETAPIKGETMFYPLKSINLFKGRSVVRALPCDFGVEVLDGRWPTSKTPLIIVFDSNSRCHFDYKLNATLVKLYAPTRMREKLDFNISSIAFLFRILILILFSVLIDVYNLYQELKMVVGSRRR